MCTYCQMIRLVTEVLLEAELLVSSSALKARSPPLRSIITVAKMPNGGHTTRGMGVVNFIRVSHLSSIRFRPGQQSNILAH